MEIFKIQLKERLLIKYCAVKHLMLLNLQNIIDIKEVLLQWFIDFLKKRQLKGRTVENENISNKKLAEQLHKPLFKKFKKRKVNSSFIDNIW